MIWQWIEAWFPPTRFRHWPLEAWRLFHGSRRYRPRYTVPNLRPTDNMVMAMLGWRQGG